MERTTLFVLLCLLACPPMSAPAEGPATVPLTDEAVNKAVANGVAYLWSQQEANGGFKCAGNQRYPAGPSALATLALLTAGEAHDSARMAKALAYLNGQRSSKTYSLALRAKVWALAERRAPGKYRKLLLKDARQLMRSTLDGSYGYNATGEKPRGNGDNSNSQYGLLGVYAAAGSGVEVPHAYWLLAMKHWQTTQNADGSWSYRAGSDTEGRDTMVNAGLASLSICDQQIGNPRALRCQGGLDRPAARRGLQWLDEHYKAGVKAGGGGYRLYGLQRMARLTGRRTFGGVDWLRAEAPIALARQARDGSWGRGTAGGNQVPETAFHILFFLGAREPAIIGKLKFDGDWNNRPHALGNLTRWVGVTSGRNVRWHVVDVTTPEDQWPDTPMLLIAGAKPPTFTDEQVRRIGRYVQAGGTILSVAECGGLAFDKAIRDLYAKLFPQHPLQTCDADHAIYAGPARLRGRPRFFVVHDGQRPLAIHTAQDLTRSWQFNHIRTSRYAFDAAINALQYAGHAIKDLPPYGSDKKPADPAK